MCHSPIASTAAQRESPITLVRLDQRLPGMSTPHGSEPTGMSLTRVPLAVSMTETEFERPFAT